jgi:hypothetical protein
VPGSDICFISPGASTEKTTVRPEHIFVYNIDGTIIEHPGGLIPLEWRIHTQIHRDRPDAMCVVHMHAPHARALGIANKPLKPVFLHGSFLCTGVPTWNNPRLVMNDDQAADLSRTVVFSVEAPGLMKQMSLPGTRTETWPNIPIVPWKFRIRVSVAVFSRSSFSSLIGYPASP